MILPNGMDISNSMILNSYFIIYNRYVYVYFSTDEVAFGNKDQEWNIFKRHINLFSTE